MNRSYLFDCKKCEDRCDGVSKGVYIFKNDVAYSQKFENEITEIVNTVTNKYAEKTDKEGYPDIEICDKSGKIICYIEVKAQRRTFMAVEKMLPKGNLKPSETIALNLSDLNRYFEIYDADKIPIYLAWAVSNRPCVLENKPHQLFFQDISILKKIYTRYGMNRRFKRRSGYGDVVNGKHKGVVVNYHFSLNELDDNIKNLSTEINMM